MGILCINHALHQGLKSAWITGLGAAVGDTVFGAIAAFGLTAIADFLTAEQTWFRLAGGCVILIAAYNTLTHTPLKQPPHMPQRRHASHFITSIIMTLTNPITIVAFLGVFAAAGMGSSLMPNYWHTLLLVGMIFLGALSWWTLLSVGISRLRHKFNHRLLLRVNQIAGGGLLVVGVWVITLGAISLF